MKTTINRSKLLEQLNRVRWTVASGQIQPLLRCFCFKEGFVTCYNGHAGTVTACDMGGMEFAVEADPFYRLIYSLTEEIDLELANDKVNLKCGRNKSWLNVHDAKTFPEIIPTNYDKFCEAPNFVQALSDVAFTVGHNVLKPELLGVCIDGNYMYTSDSFRVTRQQLDTPANGQVTLPALTINHICKLGQPNYTVLGEGLFGCMYTGTGTCYIARTLENKFPIPTATSLVTGFKNILVQLPNELAGALSRVQIVTQNVEPDAVLESTGTDMIVRTSNLQQNIGGGVETLDWPCEHKFKVSVKPSFLQQALTKSKMLDLTDVLEGSQRFLRFTNEAGFDHLMSLMLLKEE